MTAVGGWMMISGYLMHKELEGEMLLPLDILTFMRIWHNKASQVFIIVFGLQAVTGILMWLVPKLLRQRAEKVAKENVDKPVSSQSNLS